MDNINNADVKKIENIHTEKSLSETFTCEAKHKHRSTPCYYLVGVKGNENHGSHYEISIEED
jgi:hypothetical protein